MRKCAANSPGSVRGVFMKGCEAMPKGENPNSKKNLIQFSGRSREEVESISKAAGKKSGRSRQKLKSIRESLKAQLTEDDKRKMNERLISMAIHGNLKAYQLILKLLGEDPGKKIEVAGSDGEPLVIRWKNSPDEKPTS